jgi:imidazolonepropionase-like amidohydrolase
MQSTQSKLDPAFGDLIREQATVIAIEHVRIIDGTGAQPKSDQTILISGGKIAALGNSASVHTPEGVHRLQLTGYSALPGLVGMHDHLFYVTAEVNDNFVARDMPLSFPRLFLANGVTTIRTAGSYEPYTDLEIKQAIDKGKMVGPRINITGPYLVDGTFGQIQIHKLTGADDAARLVNYWAEEGMTSFKAYEYISRVELQAAIGAAHKRSLTVAGHLCSIGFREAAAMGIDSLEHGLFVDTEFDPSKQPDTCPQDDWPAKVDIEVNSAPVRENDRRSDQT